MLGDAERRHSRDNLSRQGRSPRSNERERERERRRRGEIDG